MKLGNIGQGVISFLGVLLIGLGIINAGTPIVIHSAIAIAIMLFLGIVLLVIKELISVGYTAGKIGLSDKAQAWIVFFSFILIVIGGISIPAGLGTDIALIFVLLGSLGVAFKEWATGSITIKDLGLTDGQQSFLVFLSSLLISIGGLISVSNPYWLFIAVIGAIGMGIKEFMGTYQKS